MHNPVDNLWISSLQARPGQAGLEARIVDNSVANPVDNIPAGQAGGCWRAGAGGMGGMGAGGGHGWPRYIVGWAKGVPPCAGAG